METRVPRVFHFVFGLRPQTEPFHLMYYLCLVSCIEVNKPEKVYFHYKHLPYGEWWDRIAPHLTLMKVEEDRFIASYEYKDKRCREFRYAHLADIVRLQSLIEHGGVYADMDSLFVNEVPDWFFQRPCILGKEKVNWQEPLARVVGGSLCNAWILAEKESEFIKIWLEQTYQEFDGSWSGHSTFLPYRLSRQHPELIHVEPERSFFYFDWSSAGIKGIFENCVTDLAGIYSIHLWSHLWWERSRTDFSYFHQGRLTPNYVACAETTFARAARKFLPTDIRADLPLYRKEKWLNVVENVLLYSKLWSG